MNEEGGFDYTTKKTFVMTAKNCDTVLGIDAFNRKPNPEDEGEIAFYSQRDEETTRVLKISRPSEDYRISYFDLSDSTDTQLAGEYNVPLKVGQLRTLQILIEYALPSLLGW